MQQPSRRLPFTLKSAHHYRMQREFTERSIGQWSLAASLAFGERAGVLICGYLFFCNENRDFWTFWGLVFVALHLFFISPIYGIMIYLTERLAYRARRWIGRPVLAWPELTFLGRAVHVFWLPLMVLGSAQILDLYDRLVPLKGPLDFWHGMFT